MARRNLRRRDGHRTVAAALEPAGDRTESDPAGWFSFAHSSVAAILGAAAGVIGARLIGRPSPATRSDTHIESDEMDRFLASISHELRTPLTAIIGMLDLMIDERHQLQSTEVDEFLIASREQALEIGRLVDDYVIAGRLSSESLTLRLGSIDLDEAVGGVIQGVDLVGGVKLHVANPLGSAAGDALRVRQIVRNLIRNAVRYANSEVIVATTRGENAVHLEVRNDGPAVAENVERQLFAPFVRSSRPGQPDSLGLGLNISHGLAHRMGGGLAYDRRNDWTVFTLSLPTAVPADAIVPPSKDQGPTPRQAPTNVQSNDRLETGTGLALVTQPIVDIGRAQITGFETLARVVGANGRVLHWPDAIQHYPPILLQSQAIRRALALAESAPEGCFLTVNVDPEFLSADQVFASFLHTRDLSRLVVEVTRPRPMLDERAIENLAELRSRGARVAVDNVGSTPSDITDLAVLSPDFIKIERGAIDLIDKDPDARNHVATLSTVASDIDASVIVGGVERLTQLDVLADSRVPYAQGYLLGRPAPPFPTIHSTIRAQLASIGKRWSPGTTLADLVTSCDVVVGDPSGGFASEIVLTAEGGIHLKWGEHVIALPMRAKASEQGAEVLRRAMARPADLRFSPVVAIDASGAPMGYVAIDTLIEASFIRPRDT